MRCDVAAKKPRILDCVNKSVISGLWEVFYILIEPHLEYYVQLQVNILRTMAN